MDDVETTIKTLIETQIIQALSNAPLEAMEKLVKAALSKPVDDSGNFNGYSNHKIPYIDYMVGQEIRAAAQEAARKVIRERMPEIESHVRAGLSSESIVAAVTNALVGAASEDWRITVNFEAEKQR